MSDEKRAGAIEALPAGGAGAASARTREIGRALVALSTDLDLPDGFLRNLLLEQSDWAFIVKAQAILETAVTSLLVAHLGKPELEDFVAEDMEMSQHQDARCTETVQPGATRRCAKARQPPKQTGPHGEKELFSLHDYLLDKAARLNFWKAFGIDWAATPEAKIKGIQDGQPEFVPLVPRLAIWGDVVSVVIETATATERRRLEATQADFDRKALFAPMHAAEGQAWAARTTPNSEPRPHYVLTINMCAYMLIVNVWIPTNPLPRSPTAPSI